MIQRSGQECSVGFLSTARKQQPEAGPARGAAVVARPAWLPRGAERDRAASQDRGGHSRAAGTLPSASKGMPW